MARPDVVRDVEELELYGGRLCLDFTNTVEPRSGEKRRDYLSSYQDLLRWGSHAGAMEEETAQRLRREAEERPEEAEGVLEEALRLREAIHRTFRALAGAQEPDPDDLGSLGGAFAGAMVRSRVVPTASGGFALGWRETDALERPLWPVARSAVELLTGADPARIKACPDGEGCGWLFYDGTKNNGRRWCSMRVCGSRAKMRRLYARRRGGLHPDR